MRKTVLLGLLMALVVQALVAFAPTRADSEYEVPCLNILGLDKWGDP